MFEVGIYRVAGILRDVQELRLAFDTGGTGPSLNFYIGCVCVWGGGGGADVCNWVPSTMLKGWGYTQIVKSLLH